MSSGLDKAIKDFIQIIQEAGNKGTSTLDSQAEVLRIDEDGTAWVHLPGGVDETPVRLTINADIGDTVQVRLSGGRAWITGNQTAPPTDDKTAIAARRLANLAGNRAKTAQKTADQAQIVANSALKGTKENVAQMAQMVIDFNEDIDNLQDQIDGNITTWFYSVDPAMNLPPVTDWDTDAKKDAHLGDMYYNTEKGYAWRFMKSGGVYSWERITDTDVTKALADAAAAQDTADQKRRVFYNTPTVPYDAGDLWVQGSGGDILRCSQAKTSSGSYDRNDWVLASKYTDDSAAEAIVEDLQENYSTTEETFTRISDTVEAIKTYTFYKYGTDGSGTGFSDNTNLQYRGVYTSTNNEASENPSDYKWEINPSWASQVAENYIEDEVSENGFRIVSPDPATYARFTALFMAFFMDDILQMRMGYDSVNEVYGVMAPEIHALGSGAGVKFDGSTEASVRGRFVWEIRDNGHLSLKRF